MADLVLPQSTRAFGTKKLVRAAGHKRKTNVELPDRIPAVVRDRARFSVRDIHTEPPSPPVATDKVAATAKQIAEAGGANLPIFKEGMGPVDQSSYGSVGGVGILLGNGNIVYPGGQTIIRNQQTVAEVRALFLHHEQSVTEARNRLATAIDDRNNYQRSVASKTAAWNRAIEHCDTAYQKVLALKAQQIEAQAEAITNTVSTGIVAMPRTTAIAIELTAAESAFEIANQARAVVLEALQQKKQILARAETEVQGHAFEVLIAESKLLALTAREAIQTAQQTLESLHALDAVSHRYATASTRPQTISTDAVEVLRTHMPAAQHTAAQTQAWADYIDRLSNDPAATKESQQ